MLGVPKQITQPPNLLGIKSKFDVEVLQRATQFFFRFLTWILLAFQFFSSGR